MSNRLLILGISLVFIFVFVLYTGFSSNQIQDDLVEKEIISQKSFSKFLSIGTIDSDAAKVIPKFKPTIDYIAEKLDEGYGGKVILASNVDLMVQKLKNQEIDLFIDSPLTTCQIIEKSDMIPFLIRWKQNVSEYHTVFLVKSDSDINKIDENLNGKRISLESPTSTTSFILPKFHLEQKGLVLSETSNGDSIQLHVSGSDETTAHLIIIEEVDIGAMSNLDYDELPEPMKKELKIIGQTMDIPRHVVSHRSGLDADHIQKIKTLLLEMNSNPNGIEILKNFKATAKYSELPVDGKDFCENLKAKLGVVDFS